MSQDRKIISVPVGADLKNSLDTLAEADHRPMGSYVRIVLEQHVKEARAEKPELFEQKEESEPTAA